MNMKHIILSVLLLLILPVSVFGNSVKDDPGVSEALAFLETWVDAQCAYEDIPGLSMAVVYDQEVVWSKAFGYRDLERKTPATVDTIYSICSISKLFTGIAVMQLRDKGKLRLSDKASEHLSWYTIDNLFPDGPPVTLRALLTHSSGLPRDSDFPYWSDPSFPFPDRKQFIQKMAKQKTIFPADTFFQYSNFGITLAGEVAAAVSGMSYPSYVESHILKPLGLKDTRPRLPEEHRGGRFATGYSNHDRQGKRTKLPFFQAKSIAPAAGFSSTVLDLAAFASWQFRLLEKGGKEILSANTLREMQRVHFLDPDWKTSWGLGFGVYRKDGKTFVGHGGSCPGFRSLFLMHPKSKVAVIIMSNANGVDVRSFGHNAHSLVAPAIAKATKEDTESKDETLDPSFKKYIGTYTVQPWGGETAVIQWQGGLALVGLPSDSPAKWIRKLKHIEGNTFQRIRKDGKLAEEVIFLVGKNGKVSHLKMHSSIWPKREK